MLGAMLVIATASAQSTDPLALSKEASDLFGEGQFEDALAMAEQSAALAAAGFGPDNIYTAGPLRVLANMYDALGRYWFAAAGVVL